MMELIFDRSELSHVTSVRFNEGEVRNGEVYIFGVAFAIARVVWQETR